MRGFVFAFAAAAALALAASVSLASAPTPVPVNAADFSPFQFQLGTWVCHGKSTTRPGDRVETDVTTMTLDNHWMKTHGDSPPFDKMRKQHAIYDSYFGYDPQSKLWVSVGADNLGNASFSTSTGWSGKTLTSLGYELKHGKWVATSRTVTTKVSDNEVTDVSYDLAPNGNATKSFSDDCKKQG